jgi:hypothetical protein
MSDAVIKKLTDGEGVEGILTFTNYELDPKCARAVQLDAILRNAVNIPKLIFDEMIAELRSLCRVRVFHTKNRVLLAARSMQAGRLVGVTTYSGEVNYGCLGTGSTAVDDADVDLDTEVKRKLYASRTQTDDSVSLDFYYSKSDTNGTYEEFGLVIDGTATVDTGLLFNRALTGGWVKTSLEAMTVSIQINVNAV